jgi:hypothetical protein
MADTTKESLQLSSLLYSERDYDVKALTIDGPTSELSFRDFPASTYR